MVCEHQIKLLRKITAKCSNIFKFKFMNSYLSVVFPCYNEQTTTNSENIASNLSRASFTALIELKQETNIICANILLNLSTILNFPMFQPISNVFNIQNSLQIFKGKCMSKITVEHTIVPSIKCKNYGYYHIW